jgi:hypothetical protein
MNGVFYVVCAEVLQGGQLEQESRELKASLWREYLVGAAESQQAIK